MHKRLHIPHVPVYNAFAPSLQDLLSEGVDLLVATPGRLAEHLEAGNLSLAACRVLVMDEVDVLLGEQRGGAMAMGVEWFLSS